MAAAVTTSEESGIFWIKDLSDEEQPVVFVPGVSREGKFHTHFRSGPGSSSSDRSIMMRENRAKVHIKKKRTSQQVLPHNSAEALRHNPSPATTSFLPTSQKCSENTVCKSQVSLKDLCPEDKRRITNLIEELARVSEEKEMSVKQLRNEQETFEHKIQQLEQQNILIMQERESLQQQYLECQELLVLYQQYLSEQKEKLNQSIAQLSRQPTQSKVPSGEGQPSRPCAGVDGSYLGMVDGPAGGPLQAPQRDAHGGRAAEAEPSDSLSSCSEGERADPDHGQRRRHHHRRHHRQGGEQQPHSGHRGRAGSCPDCWHGCERCPGGRPRANRHGSPDRCDPRGCDWPPCGEALGPEAEGALTAPMLGHGAWEEKRHQLLLQKMQLEEERERLQARLAEQEERLVRQNHQLRQSRLDYSRFQQATQAELSSSVAREGPSNHLPHSSNAQVNAEERVLNTRPPHAPLHTLQNGVHPAGALERSRKDMGTSPVMSPASHRKPTPVPAMPSTPKARLDCSLMELLEAFSPISVSEMAGSARRPGRYSQPDRRALLSPGGPYPQGPHQDVEESQILEEIFFIC